MEIREYNRNAWNEQVAKRNRWTVPVSREAIADARRGQWDVLLTPTRAVPREWFPPLTGLDVLGLASSGGQQVPILAAAGARVTAFDNSPRQLGQDRLVADRDGLDIRTVEGDMADLHAFQDESFDLVFHPCSNCFVPEVRPVWREAFRVLRPRGILLAGFVNPIAFLCDAERASRGEYVIRHRMPYSDRESLSVAEREQLERDAEPLSFGHSLADQIGGQLEAGFLLTALFEDTWEEVPLSRHVPLYIATRAMKPLG